VWEERHGVGGKAAILERHGMQEKGGMREDIRPMRWRNWYESIYRSKRDRRGLRWRKKGRKDEAAYPTG
jgi:hypothetical protein